MSRPSKGARLWLRPARKTGERLRPAVWLIRDGTHEESTGCGAGDRRGAEEALGRYIAAKYTPERTGSRVPSQIPIADVLSIYLADIAPNHSRPKETAQRVTELLGIFGDKPLSAINGALCRAYASARGHQAAARRELEDLRAAINHHRREGLCSEVVEVVLPEKPRPRERWLTRPEAARLLWAAWRARQKDANSDGETVRATRKHIARFILVGLYTGTRAGAICGASLDRLSGRGYIDLNAGVFYRRAVGARETKKRQPPVRLPARLLAHMRRWVRVGLCETAVVEWGGKPVGRVNKAFARSAADARLEGVSPHTLRHTAATWLMQNRCDLWEAAGYLGMTVEMLETNYGHHHPDHQKGAVEAIGRRAH
ncbi:site-specific integrase [Methylocystis rosea]|uniref:site-specific integrase n=1 Tax=Methylocystis rosea TaxID=173366 RepID=UPI00037AB502|nr:site-specific integrase [Methylocystis rosea]